MGQTVLTEEIGIVVNERIPVLAELGDQASASEDGVAVGVISLVAETWSIAGVQTGPDAAGVFPAR